MKYFAITCLQGHHGKGRTPQEITFAIMAPNLLAAQDRAKKMPSVKHSRSILLGKEITEEEYYMRRQVSAYHKFG